MRLLQFPATKIIDRSFLLLLLAQGNALNVSGIKLLNRHEIPPTLSGSVGEFAASGNKQRSLLVNIGACFDSAMARKGGMKSKGIRQ